MEKILYLFHAKPFIYIRHLKILSDQAKNNAAVLNS